MPSPKPQVKKQPVNNTLDFFSALKEVYWDKKKMYKVEWNNKDFYGEVKDGILKLHKSDGNFYPWMLSEGDLSGTDYILL